MKQDAVALRVASGSLVLDQHEFFVPADARRFGGWAGSVKRALDFASAVLMTAALLPVFLAIAVIVKRSSPGPVFYVQERLGRHGRPFRFYKFRSMRHDADDEIHRQFAAMFINGDHDGCVACNGGKRTYKLEEDPRVTPIGRWLRRTSLDELPQLLNIIAGDMSLVGPRPPIAYEIENYQPWHLERLKVVPGLTGLWQVMGRSQVSFDEMVHLDLQYINHWSLALDLKIVLRTIPVVLRGTGGM
ncbi:MAG TPA: sugar transferase [Candidatus Krumholzibacteria bacterium]|nr:sugar transferase [Candidatus Krumholzibacteria bacterium]HPD71503.1 sugar transferase [Candidatus Krumholzibacteria bacterium]HRY41564.1 sugar transferase [Candidatus Krumholzibacteria bacterium]